MRAARGQAQTTHVRLPAVEVHVSRCRDQCVGPAVRVEHVGAVQIVREELAVIAVANDASMLHDLHMTCHGSAATANLETHTRHARVEHIEYDMQSTTPLH